MDVVIFAAGAGTRLGQNCPKCLVEVAGKRIIDHQLDAIARALPTSRVYVVAGFRSADVRAHVRDVQESGRIVVIENPFFACSGINGSAWLSCLHTDSPDILRVDGDVIFSPQAIQVMADREQSTMLATRCSLKRETPILDVAGSRVTAIRLVENYAGDSEWPCMELYRNGEYQKVVFGAPELVERGHHYFAAMNKAIGNTYFPTWTRCDSVFEIDTPNDLQTAESHLTGQSPSLWNTAESRFQRAA